MKPSLQKIIKIIKLEADQGYENRAVIGGLDRIVSSWESEARAESISEDLVQVVSNRLRDYPRLSENSRHEVLEGLWRRLNLEGGTPQASLPRPKASQPPAVTRSQPAPLPAADDETDLIAIPQEAPLASRRQEPRPAMQSVEPAALQAPITVLQHVGPKHAQTLERLGLHTLRDMLYYFPRRYDDYSQLKPINRLKYGEEVTIIGTVQSLTTRPLRGGTARVVEAVIHDGTAALRVSWFNPFTAKRLHSGAHISLSGKIDQYLGRLVMNNPEWEHVEQQQLNTNRIVPVYSLTANITQRWLRKVMDQVITYWAPRMPDTLPESLRNAANLVDLPAALLQIHFPDSADLLKAARYRLAFEEILMLQIGVMSQKRHWKNRTARVFAVEQNWLSSQIQGLPFPLTSAQERAVKDICQDFTSGQPMNRLLQGDVGSGKTVVAALAIAIIASHGAQSALMAPTSILAEQHYRNMLKLLAVPADQEGASGLQPGQIRLLIGATPEAEKREILAGLASGEIKLVIGTHALIEDPITFAELHLAVIDEQHRFGVEQRAALRAKGDNLHLLVMTATPIPRSLSLTIYGDLDLSIMDEMPPGRQPVSTFVLTPRERERAYRLIHLQVEAGRQAFMIYPLIEASDGSDTKAAVEEHARLQREVFPSLNLGLMHGKLPPDEKEQVMARFASGEYHILVSTSVVEVGVDIPNATVMLIEGANRFGLAQLHQFRGRVGRGSQQSYCLLIPETPDAVENERLLAMSETNDGFVLAEKDLQQRGPGDFLGTRQAGFADLQLARLTDVRLIDEARRHAQTLLDHDPELSLPENALLAAAVEQFWSARKGEQS